MTEAEPVLIAHVDETTPAPPDGTLLYGMAAVLTAVSDEPAIAAELGGLLLPHQAYLQLVAQIGFTEWTRAGVLRHPRYTGLRIDKDALDEVRES